MLKAEFEQGQRRDERVPAARGQQRHFRVMGWVITQEELGGAVVIGRSQQCFPGADTVTLGQRLSPQFLDALCGGLPFAMPAGLIAIGDRPGGHQDLAEVGAAVVGEAGRAQGLE